MSLSIEIVRTGTAGQLSGLGDAGVLMAVTLVGGLAALAIPEQDFSTALTGCLTQHYGASNTLHEQDPVQYIWLWDPLAARWIRICIAASRYLIDDGGATKLRVGLEIGAQL